MIPYKQLSLADIFTDCQEKFENDKPAFLSLLETHTDIDEIIPISFRNHFYASTGRTRKYPLQAFLWALIIQRIFSIPTDQLLLTFLGDAAFDSCQLYGEQLTGNTFGENKRIPCCPNDHSLPMRQDQTS